MGTFQAYELGLVKDRSALQITKRLILVNIKALYLLILLHIRPTVVCIPSRIVGEIMSLIVGKKRVVMLRLLSLILMRNSSDHF